MQIADNTLSVLHFTGTVGQAWITVELCNSVFPPTNSEMIEPIATIFGTLDEFPLIELIVDTEEDQWSVSHSVCLIARPHAPCCWPYFLILIRTSEFNVADSLFNGWDMLLPTNVPGYQRRTLLAHRCSFGQMPFLPPPITYMVTSGIWTQARSSHNCCFASLPAGCHGTWRY